MNLFYDMCAVKLRPPWVTPGLDDFTYKLFVQFANADNWPISNMIETAARKRLEECTFVSETEMRGIESDRALVRRLKSTSGVKAYFYAPRQFNSPSA